MPAATTPHRILVIGASQEHLDATGAALRTYTRESEGDIDLVSVRGLDAALPQFEHYTHAVILHYGGETVDTVAPTLAGVRRRFRGPIIVVNDDASVESCEWGRRYAVDYHTQTVEKLPEYLNRILAGERARGKAAIVLAGGGILGGFYEAGALKALYAHGINDFDMYIGLSAGGFVASLAANGISPDLMIDHPDLGWADFYHPNWRDMTRKAVMLGPNIARRMMELVTERRHDLLFQLSGAMTTSPLDGSRLRDRFLEILEREEGTNDFAELRDLGRELFVMAVDLDSAERRLFGAGDDVHVPIVEAVMASAALPLFYRPVRIDGRDYVDGGIARSACIDAAIDHGADLIVCVNPLVPYTAGEAGSIADLGLAGIADQSVRALIQARLHETIRRYEQLYPEVTILLIEPDTTADRMFHNPLSADRDLIEDAALYGFQTTQRRLDDAWDYIAHVFADHGRPLGRRPARQRSEERAVENQWWKPHRKQASS